MPERGSKMSTVPVIWATFGIFSAQSKWFPVEIDDHGRNLDISLWPGDKATTNGVAAQQLTLCCPQKTWIYHYDLETKQQPMEWQHSSSPRTAPKNSKCKNALEKFSSRSLGSRRHPPHWLSSKGPNYQRGVLLISAGVNEGHFEGKTPWEGHEGGSCSCTTMLRLTKHLQPRRYWPTWASSVLIINPILKIWPCWTTTCSLDWKKQLKVGHFSSNAEVNAAVETWLDRQLSEFLLSGLQKLEQRAKKCIELRGEYVEETQSLVTVACFLPGWAKDLSPPPRIMLTDPCRIRSQPYDTCVCRQLA